MGPWMRLMLISFLHPTEPFREHHHGAGGLAAMQAFRACFEVRRPTPRPDKPFGFQIACPTHGGPRASESATKEEPRPLP